MLLHNLSSYGTTGINLSIIKSFLTYCSLKIVNGQSPDVHVSQGSLHDTAQFLLCINDLVRSMRRNFVDIYADVTAVYGCTSKILDNQSLAVDLSSDLALMAQWYEN